MNQAKDLIHIVLKQIVFYFFCLIICSCHQKGDNTKIVSPGKPAKATKVQIKTSFTSQKNLLPLPFYHSPLNVQIEQITPRLTYKLRRDVLYPDKQIAEMEMAEDNNGVHFGGFKDNKLVAVVSLFQKDTDFQFRKLAVDPIVQNMGLGNAMLKYIEAYAIENRGARIWCNARLSAIGFYLKANYSQTGELFTRDGIDFQILEKPLTPSADH